MCGDDRIVIADIHAVCDRSLALVGQLLHQIRGELLLKVQRRHLGAGIGQLPANFLADGAAAPGDHRHLILQLLVLKAG